MLTAIAVALPPAFAQDTRPTADIGPMVAYPILTVSAGYATGLKYVGPDQEGEDSQGSWVVSGSLGGGTQGEYRGHLYGVEYEALWAGYTDSSTDNYLDHRLTAYGGTAFDIRNNLDVGLEYLKAHDPRYFDDPVEDGRDSRFAAEPDEWHQIQAGLNYVFGAPGARGRVECSACQTNRRYDNNDQEDRDRDMLDLGVELIARVTPKTELLVGTTYSDFDYVNEDPSDVSAGKSLDSTEMRYYAGANWEASPKTMVELDVGLLEKEYDNSSTRRSYSEPFWRASVDWAPRGTTAFNAGYSRGLYERVIYDPDVESGFGDDTVEVDDLHAGWSEQWGERWTSDVTGYYQWLDYLPSGRSDNVYGVTAGIDYAFNRWLGIGVNAYYQQRDSSEPEYSYDDSGVSLTLTLGEGLGWGAKAPDICKLR